MWSTATTRVRLMHYHYVNANKIILGCYEKAISYSYVDGESRIPIPMSQIESLIQLSESCVQDIQYDCTLAPLALDGIDFAFWEDRTGEINNYFTGIILILLLHCNVTILNQVFLKEVTMGSMFVIVTMRQKDVLKKKPDTTPAIVTRIFP